MAREATIGRIDALITLIRDEALTSVRRGTTDDARTRQRTIDRALAEISSLIGTDLVLGGSEYAVVQGLNPDQIVRHEIRALPVNITAEFSGSRRQPRSPARIALPQARELGLLQIETLQGAGQIRIPWGISESGLAGRINSLRHLGITSRVSGGTLEIETLDGGRNAFLDIVAARQSSISAYGQPLVNGVDPSQVASLDTQSLVAGIPVTVNGSRDALATAASLTYQGKPGAMAAGSASFRLTGPLGSANFSVAVDEALAAFAQRINDASATTGVVATVTGNDIDIRSSATGASETIVIDNVSPASVVSVSGANAAQVADINVLAIPDETETTLSGTVTKAADSARQTYHGDPGGLVADSATFTITGTSGNTAINIVQGESLANVAQRINDASPLTGVAASTDGDDLVLYSVGVGSSESVQITLDSITQYVSVSGVNATQISNFQVVTAAPDTVHDLIGSVTQAATRGQLEYTGALGATTASAEFTLTGELGSTTITVNAFQSLTSVRDAINAVSDTTGVDASVAGNTLSLTSSAFGSSAIVEVNVTSGLFTTTGGDGNGNAAGLDALLQINGNSVTANGNDVAYSDANGNYTFSLVEGFAGAIDTITVTSANGTFQLTGGDPSGMAYGIDAEATINGEAFVAAGNDINFSVNGVAVDLTLVHGVTGTLDPITIASNFAEFSIVGGGGNGSAAGTDEAATINGQSLTSSNGIFNFSTSGGPLALSFDDGFLGEFTEISITYGLSPATRLQHESFFAAGGDADAIVNGATTPVVDGWHILEMNGAQVAVQFAGGFQGEFDPFTVTGRTIDISSSFSSLPVPFHDGVQAVLSELFMLASGGTRSGLQENAGRALASALDALLNFRALTRSQPQARVRQLTGSLFDSHG